MRKIKKPVFFVVFALILLFAPGKSYDYTVVPVIDKAFVIGDTQVYHTLNYNLFGSVKLRETCPVAVTAILMYLTGNM